MKKILFVFGTRPEAIKMLPIFNYACKFYSGIFEVKICVTGQHRKMLDQVLEAFGVVPNYDLNIMEPKQDLYDITNKVLLGLRKILQELVPDCVLVHGDTTTSFSTALAAYYQKIPIAHIEAGLRTYNIYSPWPEEINRTLIGSIAKFHFAPTNVSRNNLAKENIFEHVVVVGNSVIDALLWMIQKINKNKKLSEKLTQFFRQKNINFHDKKTILVTGHRRENFGDGLINICNAIREVALLYPDFQVIYPVHFNPNVQKPVFELLSSLNNVYLIEPLDYQPFVFLMQQSYIILTDSGGVQEEAPSLNKPVLVMRDTTERPEVVEEGGVRLVGTNKEVIVNAIKELIIDDRLYSKMASAKSPYGDGNTSKYILEYLANNL